MNNIIVNPNLKQSECLNLLLNKNGKTHILYGGAAGGGKTWLGCVWLIYSCLTYPGTRWILGRTELKALKESSLNTLKDVAIEWEIMHRIKINLHTNEIVFDNGSIILLKNLEYKPSDPNFDSLGSIEVTGAYVDEATQLSEKAYHIIGSRIRYKLNEYNLEPKFLLTCNPAKNFLYSLFYKPHIKNEIARYRYFIQAKVKDNPYISKEYVENLEKMPPDLRARLRDGDWDWDEADNQLIGAESIYNLPSTHIAEGDMFLTGDVARFGKDRSVYYIWKGFTVIECIIIEKADLQTQINLLKLEINKYKIQNSNIIIDSDGVGGGVCDALRARAIVNNSRAIGAENFKSLKDQLYYKLSEKIDDFKIYESVWQRRVGDSTLGEMLGQELSYVRSDNGMDGKLSIMKKDRVKELIGRSPDFSDALAYRMLPILSAPIRVARRH
jgi:phage terminase large subunit